MISHIRNRSAHAALLTIGVLTGCTHTVKVEPIKVEPIDITLHIYLEADQKLDAFFSEVDKPVKSPSGTTPPTSTTPVTPGQTEGAR